MRGLLAGAAIVFLFAMTMNAMSQDCPPGATSCKVVTITPDEGKVLDIIFDTAVWANRAQLTDAVTSWRQKINQSANGEVKKTDANGNVSTPKK